VFRTILMKTNKSHKNTGWHIDGSFRPVSPASLMNCERLSQKQYVHPVLKIRPNSLPTRIRHECWWIED